MPRAFEWDYAMHLATVARTNVTPLQNALWGPYARRKAPAALARPIYAESCCHHALLVACACWRSHWSGMGTPKMIRAENIVESPSFPNVYHRPCSGLPEVPEALHGRTQRREGSWRGFPSRSVQPCPLALTTHVSSIWHPAEIHLLPMHTLPSPPRPNEPPRAPPNDPGT